MRNNDYNSKRVYLNPRYKRHANRDKRFPRGFVGIMLAICIPIFAAVFVVSSIIADNNKSQSHDSFAKETKETKEAKSVDKDNDEKGNEGKDIAKNSSLFGIMINTASGSKLFEAAYSIGTSLAKSYVPQPRDKHAFRLDARRLIFAKPGDSLKVGVEATPPEVDLDDDEVTFESSDESIATVDEDGTVTAKDYGKCTISAKVGNLKTDCLVSVAQKWVAITFDDGPGSDTPRLLEAMRKVGANSTFFLVGSCAAGETGESRVREEYFDGNEIANHTWNHDGSAANLMNGLKKTDDVIKKVTGKPSELMRPPGGAINNSTKNCGKPIIMWSVDPRDWEHRDADYVTGYITKNVRSGDIVLLHDIHTTSVDAAIRIFNKLDNQGYTFVTVSQLVGEMKPGQSYNSGSEDVKTMKIPY